MTWTEDRERRVVLIQCWLCKPVANRFLVYYMNDIEKVVPAFELALGEEDGTLFGAILWPVDIGAVPYSTPIELFFVENGFILKGESGEHPIEFQGVSDETLAELERRVIVILEKVGDEFDQHPVRQGW